LVEVHPILDVVLAFPVTRLLLSRLGAYRDH
jgi:hypothetical protein